MMLVRRLFNRVRFAAWNIRRKDPTADVEQFWQFIKTQCDKYPMVADWGWKELDHVLCDQLMSIVEVCEVDHFLRQHANIPINYPPSLTNIFQIALNSGLLMGTIIGQDHGNTAYLQNKLYDINTYVHIFDIRLMTAKVPLELEKSIEDYLGAFTTF
jgi:hypothetical protein